jgi:uncharacterized protein HemX
MVVLGVLLLLLAVALVVGVALDNDVSTDVSVFGQEVTGFTTGTLFLAGVATGFVLALSLGLVLAGLKRRRAKEQARQRQVRAARSDADSLAEENARLQDELARKQAAEADSYPTPVEPAHGTDGARHGSGHVADT